MISEVLIYDSPECFIRHDLLSGSISKVAHNGHLVEILETLSLAQEGKLEKLNLNELPGFGFEISIPILGTLTTFRYYVSLHEGKVEEELTYIMGIENPETVMSYSKEEGFNLVTDDPDIIVDYLTDDMCDLLDTDLALVIPRVIPNILDKIDLVKVNITKEETTIINKIMSKLFPCDISEVDQLKRVTREVELSIYNNPGSYIVVNSYIPQTLDIIKSDSGIINKLEDNNSRLIVVTDDDKKDHQYTLSCF